MWLLNKPLLWLLKDISSLIFYFQTVDFTTNLLTECIRKSNINGIAGCLCLAGEYFSNCSSDINSVESEEYMQTRPLQYLVQN